MEDPDIFDEIETAKNKNENSQHGRKSGSEHDRKYSSEHDRKYSSEHDRKYSSECDRKQIPDRKLSSDSNNPDMNAINIINETNVMEDSILHRSTLQEPVLPDTNNTKIRLDIEEVQEYNNRDQVDGWPRETRL